MLRLKEIQAKSMMVASSLPDADYVVNPYTGCEFGCHYCYASFMGRFAHEPVQEWGRYLHVKTNAVDVLDAELKGFSDEKKKKSVFLSSVTDPYQGAEARYKLTRGILETFERYQYSGVIGILTKSGMIKRDIDVLKRLPCVEVGLTITSTDDGLSRFMEVKAPAASVRLKTLAKLNENDIKTYAFVGPLFPHFRYQEDKLKDLFESLYKAGVREIYAEHINCKPYIISRLAPALENQPLEIRNVYRLADTHEHREALSKLVLDLVKAYGFHLRLGEVIYHGQPLKQKKVVLNALESWPD